MKITKRILAVLILMALLVCCVLLSVSAEGTKKTFNADGISDIEDILEYYSFEYFVADNYEGKGPDSEYYFGDKSEIAPDPIKENNSVLKVTALNNAYKIADTDSPMDSFIVSFDICYDAAMQGEYRLNVKTLDENGVESITFTTLFSVNAADGKLQYSVWDADLNNGEGGFVLTDFEGIAPVADTWYKVVVSFNAPAKSYSFKILYENEENEPAQIASDKIFLGNVCAATELSLKSYTSHRGNEVLMYLDDVEIYLGTYERNPAKKGYVTACTLVDLEALFNSEQADLETQVRIARVFEELCLSGKHELVLDYDEAIGITPDSVSEVQSNIGKYVNLAFAKELIRIADSIDVEGGYKSRIEHFSDVNYYNGILPANEELAAAPGIDAELAEKLVSARAAIENERAAWSEIAEHSENFIEAMYSYDDTDKNYDGYLKPFYDKLCGYEKWDITYPAMVAEDESFTMAKAAARYEEFIAKYSAIATVADTFISGASEMKNALPVMTDADTKMKAALEILGGIDIEDENLSESQKALYIEQKAIYEEQKAIYEEAFARVANGYFLAKTVYNSGDIHENLEEATYEELFSLLGVYIDNEDFVIQQTANSDKFVQIIKSAEIATYYTSKVERLKEAESYLADLRLLYGGVAEALEKYNELKAAIAEQEAAAVKYIESVAVIASAQTHAERKAAVEAATALKAEGDVLGFDGVSNANMLLSEAASRIEFEAANSAALITLVKEIAATREFLARRQLLGKAQYAALNSDETIEGVTDAKAALLELIDAYAAEANKMNTAHAASSEMAADLIGSAASDESVYKAASVIKDFVNG